MGIFGGTAPPSCPSSRHCAEWARIYLKYCLCSPKDGVALTLGLLSVISWGVAEVPQIITNYRQKSTEGLSIAFLMTWIVGDLFNLVGCFLEPATLQKHGDASLREKLLGAKDGGASRNIHSDATVSFPSSPIPVNGKVVEQDHHGSSSPSTDYYYVSARSLSRSPVPASGTWLGNNRQSSRTPPQMNDQRDYLSGEIAPAKPVPSAKNVLSVVPWMSLLLVMCVLHFLVGNTHMEVPSGTVISVGRRLLMFTDDLGYSSLSHGSGSGIGSFLGWAMAIIYMGGRLPQIFLNVSHRN
ncbi:hypothetical protein PR202_gb26902 [Eleusine coracana subsp. coracana]|uniref:Uncharacterized protein n=1 Tax=Eleusine coracana subsp. coracana TaxID=191504 RepID=A0AAV5FTB6_ELECO|nr:hypothetical protein PR202_gb26902 [Eleusine coracana subsp. coracana]